MPQTDRVHCFYSGSSIADGPDFSVERSVARQWKNEGKGYFVSHGKFFQLITAVMEAVTELLGHGNLVPFSRVQKNVGGLYLKPQSISYPIPACGDHRIRWHSSFMNA